jgi:hypothetical protein
MASGRDDNTWVVNCATASCSTMLRAAGGSSGEVVCCSCKERRCVDPAVKDPSVIGASRATLRHVGAQR